MEQESTIRDDRVIDQELEAETSSLIVIFSRHLYLYKGDGDEV